MRVGFFVEKWGSVSETFITDLIVGLSNDKEIDCSIIANNLNGGILIKVVEILEIPFYALTSKFFIYLEKSLQLLGMENEIGKRRLALSYRNLYKNRIQTKIDVAYIDFGQIAILIRKYLVRHEIPFVVHFHGKDATQLMNDRFYLKEIKKVFHDASFILVASNHIKRRLVLEGCEKEKIKLVRLGVNIDKIKVKSEYHKKPYSFIHVGRLIEKKHPIATIHAFKLVKEKFLFVKLTLIGTGPLFNKCKQLINQLDLDESVNLAGSKDHKEILDEYANHDIYVQHSVSSSRGDQEGFALSLTEAMCAGLPVISTLHNGIPENVVDGETGFLVTEFDYEEMANKMIYLIEHPEMIKKMGQNGRKRVKKYFDQKIRVKNMSNLLSELANG